MLLHGVVFGKRGLQEVWLWRMRMQMGLRLVGIWVQRVLFEREYRMKNGNPSTYVAPPEKF